MTDFERTLWSELDATPVVDPHTHLNPARPPAANLADLVLYHHVWIELLSAGMPITAVTKAGLPHELADPGMSPEDRVRAALPYLPAIRNTTCAQLLATLLEDLYGVPEGRLAEANLERVEAAVARRAADPMWETEVLRSRCHIEASLTVEGSAERAARPGLGAGVEHKLSLENGKQTPAQVLDGLERSLGVPLPTAEELGAALHARGRDYAARPLHYVGLWLPAHFGGESRPARAITAVLERARAGQALGDDDLSAFASYAARSLLSGLEGGNVRTLQVIVGADVLPPHRAITQWGAPFVRGLATLAGEFEGLHFNCSTASDLYTQDLAILAKHLPNVSVAGYWWHTLYPYYLRKSIETRLDIVPLPKIVGFFSDAYHTEWCHPKLKLVKRIFGEVLLDRVTRGLLRPNTALSLLRPIFYDNPKRIYGVAPGTGSPRNSCSPSP